MKVLSALSGVTSFGFFVELDQGIAEGLVQISSLVDQGLKFDAGKQQLSNGKQSYVLGDKVEVVLNKVDMKLQKMDFTLLASVIAVAA